MPPFLAALLSLAGGGATAGAGLVGGLLGSIVSGAATVATGAINTVGSMAVSAIGSVVRAVVAIPGLIVNTVVGLLGAINSGGGAIIGSILKVATVIGGLASGALAAFGKYLQISVRAMMEFSRAAGELKASTGLGYGASAGVLQRFGVFGIGPEAVQGAFGGVPPALFRMKAGAFGLPGYDDPNFIGAYAARRSSLMGQGLTGQMTAQAMDRLLGTNSPLFQMLSNLSQGQIGRQQNYASRVFSGIGEEGIRKYATEIPLTMGRIGAAFEALKMKAAIAALPVLERVGDWLSSIAASNLDSFVAMIQSAIQWLFVKAPLYAMKGAEMVIGAAQYVVTKATEITGWLAQNLPAVLGNAINWVVNMVRGVASQLADIGPKVIDGLTNAMVAIGQQVGGMLVMLGDAIIDLENDNNPFRGIALAISNGVDLLNMAGTSFKAAAAGIWVMMVNSLISGASAIPVVGPAISLLLANKGIRMTDPIKAYRDVWANASPIDTQGPLQNWLGGMRPMGQGVRNAGLSAQQRSNMLASAASGVLYNGLDRVLGGLDNVTRYLAPAGQPNRGYQAGMALQPYLQGANDFFKNVVQPNLDTLETSRRNIERGLGTEQERNATYLKEIADNTKGTTEALRDMAKNGNAPDSSNQVLAYFLDRVRREEVRNLRAR